MKNHDAGEKRALLITEEAAARVSPSLLDRRLPNRGLPPIDAAPGPSRGFIALPSAFLGLAFSFAAACGKPPPVVLPGPDAGEVDAGAPFTTDSLCDQLARAQCGLLERCFPAFNRLAKDDCVVAQSSACTAVTNAIAVGVRDGRARFEEAAMKACIDRMASASCPAALPPTAPPIAARGFEDCTADKFFVGNVDDGSECKTAQECKVGSRCVIFGGACGGACTPFSKVGEPCSGVCDPTQGYCDTVSRFCVALQAEGGTCKDSSNCVAATDCQGSVCLPPPPPEAPCAFSWNRLPYCGAGLACDVVPYVDKNPGTCVIRRSEGEACKYHWSCRAGLVCAGMDWSPFPGKPAGPGTCKKPLVEGAACSYTRYAIYVGDECASGLSCDAKEKKCRRRPKNGEACTVDVQNCVGDNVYCKPDETGAGKCGAAPGIGETCRIELQTFPLTLPCRDGYCDTDTKVCTAANAREGAACYSNAQCLTGRCVVQQDKSLKCGKRCG